MQQGRVVFFRPPGIIGFLILIAIFVGLFFLAKGIFTLLSYAAPVLFVLAAIINYKTIVNYVKFVLSLMGRNPLAGIITVILSVIGYPILGGYLFFKSILDRKVRKLQQSYQQAEQDEYVDYEVMDDQKPIENIELPPLDHEPEIKKTGTPQNPYKDLF